MASNFFNKASLVMVPDAPIDGKLPSVKPEDRSGDFTFSRGSNLAATRVNKDGLIEKGRENLLLQSNQFDTTWYNTTSSETGGQIGYDGSNDAWELSISAAAGRLTQLISLGGVQTFSVYAKAGTYNFLDLYAIGNVAHSAYFDLSTGSVGTTFSLIDSSITSVGNGWYKCSITFSDTTLNVRFYPAVADNDLTGTSGSIYIQDAQLEQGLAATGYIETTTAAVQKGILENLPRIDYSGGASCPSLLLEPQRTQLIPQSEYFGGTQWPVDGVSLDANNATSPEGLQNAYKITDDISTGYHKITKTNVFAADGTMRTWSVFVKKGNARYCVISHAEIFSSYVNSLIFDMQEGVYTNEGTTNYFDIVQEPIDMGNGWWRIGFSSDLNSSSYDNFSIGISRGADWLNNASYTGDGSLNFYIYGAQCELGSYSTSYIPAYGSSVTRSLDVSSLGGLQTSSILNGTKGTFLFEGIKNQDWYFTNFVITANSKTNKSLLIDNSGSAIRLRAWDTSGLDATITTLGISNGTFKYLIRWDNGDLKVFINGVSGGTATISPYSYTTLDLSEGTWSRSSPKQLLFFPTALTDDECIALTTI